MGMDKKMKVGSAFSLQLARALEAKQWELFSIWSRTSLEEGMVEMLARFIREWMDECGFEVWYVKKDG